MTHNLDTAHFNMLEQQVRPSDVLNPLVLNVLENTRREQFVDEEFAGLAYADTELPIAYGQHMLSPVVVGRLLQALNVQPNENVLEIGTGSGYFTALLAQLAHHVTSVEIIPELSEMAQQRLNALNIDNVTYCIGDASQSWKLNDRIDVIVATAAFAEIPDDYLQSLKVGGRMLAVVGVEQNMSVQLIHRITEREWKVESIFETVIPAMINAEPEPKFEF